MKEWNTMVTSRHMSSHTVLIAVIGSFVLMPGIASGFQSNHNAMDMVWNSSSFDCESVAMTLVDDFVWECVAPAPSAETYYLQFWPGSSMEPKYGADINDPLGLILDDDPSQVPVSLANSGYYTIRLLEAAPSFELVGAPGSIIVSLVFSDDPISPPTDSSVMVLDLDFDIMLGFFTVGGGTGIDVVNLIPDHTYRLTVTATGYRDESLTVSVPDASPVPVTVALDRLVANENTTWSGFKALFR